MPIIETLEPKKPEELQQRIFATKKGEDHIIIQAVCEHVRSHAPHLPFLTSQATVPLWALPSHRDGKRVRAETK